MPSSPVAQNGQPTAQPAWERDAQRVPLARRRAGRVVHEHRLDEQPVGQAVDRLLGQDAVGEPDLAVVDRVQAERGLELGRGAAPGSVRTSSQDAWRPRHAASRTWRARYAGLAALARTTRPSASRREAADPGALVARAGGGGGGPQPERRGHDRRRVGHRVDDDTGRRRQPGSRRPRSQSAPGIGPPAGRRHPLEHEPAVGRGERRAGALADERARARRPRPAGASDASVDDEPARRAARGTCPGHGWKARTRRSSVRRGQRAGRGGRPRGGAAGSARRRRPAWGPPASSPRSHGPRLAASSSAAERRQPRLELGRALVARRAARRRCATIGPVSSPASMRISVTAVAAVAGEDRGRDRRGAAAARQRGRVEVERAVRQVEQRPAARSARSRRGRRARAAGRGPRRSPPGARSRGGREDGPEAQLARRAPRSASAVDDLAAADGPGRAR